MTVVTLVLVAILLLVIYLFFRDAFNHWKRLGYKQIPAAIPFGNFTRLFCQQMTLGEILWNLYVKAKDERVIGIYASLRPVLLVCDLKLIRSICVKDFSWFCNRGIFIDEKNDPLSAHLFAMPGDEWRDLRTKLTPLFSSGKLRSMMPTLLKCGAPLEEYVDEMVCDGKGLIEMKEIFGRYTNDVIASIAFGVDVDSFANPDNEFRRNGRKIFDLNLANGLRLTTLLVWPELQKLLRFKSFGSEVEKFMIKMVKEVIEYREANNIVRKDLIQMLIELRNKGIVDLKDDEWASESSDKSKSDVKKAYTINQIAAQAFIFYIGGFETSSSTTAFCLYELAKHPEMQRKAQQEIDKVLERYDGEITYDGIKEMKYLELCVTETLRLYPPIPIINRQCTKNYIVSSTRQHIKAGTPIMIPILGLQRDAKYFPDPDEFKPERVYTQNNYADDDFFRHLPYFAFGDGPRNCIGMRLGKMQTFVALVIMLSKFHFEFGPDTPHKIEFSPKCYVLTSKSGLHLNVTKRTDLIVKEKDIFFD